MNPEYPIHGYFEARLDALQSPRPFGGSKCAHSLPSSFLPFRKKLHDFFISLEFDIIKLPLSIGSGVRREEEGRDSHEHMLISEFYSKVTSKCTEEATVVIYISGIQFPLSPDQVSF